MGELIQDLKRELREEILQGMSYERQMTDEELSQVIDGKILEQMEREPMALRDRLRLQKELFDSFRRLDILQELVDDPGITEIMVNGPEEVFVETEGRIRRWEKSFESREQLLELIRQIVSRVNRTVNTASPIVDARLEDGSRVHVVLEPVALNGPILTIRKFPDPITMDRLLEYGSVTREAADLLKILAAARYNIFVSGGTGAGKTTFLNALSEFIPPEERVITIEDSAELKLAHIENLVRLETRNANGEGQGAIGIGMLIRAALRMRPDHHLRKDCGVPGNCGVCDPPGLHEYPGPVLYDRTGVCRFGHDPYGAVSGKTPLRYGPGLHEPHQDRRLFVLPDPGRHICPVRRQYRWSLQQQSGDHTDRRAHHADRGIFTAVPELPVHRCRWTEGCRRHQDHGHDHLRHSAFGTSCICHHPDPHGPWPLRSLVRPGG
mgnify:CR=1 FL=1